MSKQNKRRNFDSNFKAKVALEAIQEKLTLSELASKYDVFPTQISDWKKDFLAGAGSVFDNIKAKKADKSEDVTALYEQIGRLQMDIAFLKKKL
jgi:transposase-like protein